MQNSVRTALVPVLCTALAAAALAQTAPGIRARCESAANDNLSIDACTALISSSAAQPDEAAAAYYIRGTKYFGRGQADRAIQDYSEAIRLRPRYPEALNSRGLAYGSQGQYARAIQDYDQAIQFVPDDASSLRGRGLAYAMDGQFQRAIQDYDEAIRLRPEDPRSFTSRGEATFFLARFAESSADLRQSLTLGPKQPYMVLMLHIANRRQGQDDAQDLARRVATMDPARWPFPIAQLYLGRATPDDVFAAAKGGPETAPETAKDQRCEAAFYLGEHALFEKRLSDAVPLLQQARDTCPKTFVEYVGAVSELKRLGK